MMSLKLLDTFLSPSASRGAVILCFHQIGAEKFRSWIHQLARCFQLVTLDEIVKRRNGGLPLSKLMAITLDDGWAGACEPIAEICEREKWPVTIYVMSSLFESATTFWFAQFPRLLSQARGRRLEIDGRVLDMTNRQTAESTAKNLRALLRSLPGTEALGVVAELQAAGDLPDLNADRPDFVDLHFLRRYATSEWITFGSHSVDHQSLSSQSDEQIRWQLLASKNRLEEITEKPVTHFCYPYGDAAAIGTSAPAIAREYYESATTMNRGVCDETCDLWYLPRIPIYDRDSYMRFLVKIGLARWV